MKLEEFAANINRQIRIDEPSGHLDHYQVYLPLVYLRQGADLFTPLGVGSSLTNSRKSLIKEMSGKTILLYPDTEDETLVKVPENLS
jgi:hypothetical protein